MKTFAEIRNHVMEHHSLMIDEPFLLGFESPADGGDRKQSMFLAELDKKSNEVDPFYVSFYTVKKGDTVHKIAMKLGAPVNAIIDLNKLGRKAMIRAGKNILIPFKRNLNTVTKKTGI